MYVAQSGTTRKLWEASGIGEYDKVGNWAWQYYPPPYDFLAPTDSVAIPAPILYTPPEMSGHYHPGGLGGCSCGGTCGACSAAPHVHSFSGVTSPGYPAGPGGLGLFDSMDMTSWGAGEWLVVGVGGYLAISIFGDLLKGGRAVRKTVRRRRSTSRKREQLKEELAGL
jgi:hypothetical protein